MNKKRLQVYFLIGVMVMYLGCDRKKTLEELAVEKQAAIVNDDKRYLKQNYGVNIGAMDAQQLEAQRKDMLVTSTPWLSSNLVDTMDVLDFVLPQMVNNSIDTGWRLQVKERMRTIRFPEGKITDEEFLKFCNQVNDTVKKQMTFGRAGDDESLLTYATLSVRGKGSCVAMSDYTNYTFRALGIPVTTDFIPIWGNLNAPGHAWNRLLLKDRSLPFMGAESNIGDYNPLVLSVHENGSISTKRLPAKVYRQSRYGRGGVDFFGKMVLDVTDDYVDVNSISIEQPEKTRTPLYLATFNRGKYIVVAIGSSAGNKINFNKMGTGLVYFPVKLERATPVPAGYPVVCMKGSNKTMKPDLNKIITVDIDHLLPLAQGQMDYLAKYGYNGFDKIDFHDKYDVCPLPQEQTSYELWYWDMGWKMHSIIEPEAKRLIFQSVPGNAVYLIKALDEPFDKARPFAFDRGTIEWF